MKGDNVFIRVVLTIVAFLLPLAAWVFGLVDRIIGW